MAKRESSFFNMVITLLVVTGVAALSLGAVFNATKEPIAAAKQAKKEKAIKEVLPAFDELKSVMVPAFDDPNTKMEFNQAYKGDQLIGTAVETYTNKGFSGLVKIMVGITAEGKVHNISVLEHKETPGLGTKMAGQKFKGQFENMDLATFSNVDYAVKKDRADSPVDAITAATISSRAFCDAVKRAHQTYLKEGGKQ